MVRLAFLVVFSMALFLVGVIALFHLGEHHACVQLFELNAGQREDKDVFYLGIFTLTSTRLIIPAAAAARSSAAATDAAAAARARGVIP